MEPKLAVNEMFYSIQGEGCSAGLPAFFLRLAGCNLHCSFCDIPQSWDFKRFQQSDEVHPMTSEEVLGQCQPFFNGEVAQSQLLVVTGGEPLLQQRGLTDFLSLLNTLAVFRDTGAPVEIETNGTIEPTAELDNWVFRYNVSPKLLSSEAGTATERIRLDVLRWFASQVGRTQFKFVVSDDSDFLDLSSLLQRVGTIHREQVVLMPEGATPERLQETSLRVVEFCKRNGFRYSDRLQIRLWGTKRGV